MIRFGTVASGIGAPETAWTAFGWEGLELHDDSFYDPLRQLFDAAGMSVDDLLDE